MTAQKQPHAPPIAPPQPHPTWLNSLQEVLQPFAPAGQRQLAALGRHEEFELHVRATRNTGVTPEEIAEVLLQVGAYAGVPAANSALKIAKRILSEEAG